MTKNISNRKNVLTIALLLAGSVFFAQNQEQSRMFTNRTHVALAKVEKEMYFSNNNTYAADLKKAIKYQMIAINFFKSNDFVNAVAYSYKSRVQCMEICTNMSIAEGQTYALTNEEKVYCDPNKYVNVKMKTDILSADDTKKVDELNLLDPAKFHELKLSTVN